MHTFAAAQAGAEPDRGVMARMFAYLYGLGGALVLVTLAMAHSPDRSDAPLLVVAALAIGIAVGFVWSFDRTPMWVFRLAPGAGAVLIGVLAYSAGPTGAAAYLFFLLWVSLSASYFFGLLEALANAVFASAVVVVSLLSRGDIDHPGQLIVMVAGTMLVNGFVMVGLRYQVQELMLRLDHAARTDFLTRLANRREFNERLVAEIARTDRTGRPLSVLVLDLDSFKLINDRYGHDAGDEVLETFASLVSSAIRKVDLAARIGGEEFGVLAPETTGEEGAALGERLRRIVEEAFQDRYSVTTSCGVAEYRGTGTDPEQLLRDADRALYAAKADGRNRVAASGPEPGRPEDAPAAAAPAPAEQR